jgi:hypothetical protein
MHFFDARDLRFDSRASTVDVFLVGRADSQVSNAMEVLVMRRILLAVNECTGRLRNEQRHARA